LKTEKEIKNIINWLGNQDADVPSDDLPYVGNSREFKKALLWVLNPNTAKPGVEAGNIEPNEVICPECGGT